MKKLAILFCVLTIALMAVAPYAMAGDTLVRGATSDHYLTKAPSMLFRGLHNVAFGWAELIVQPINHSKNAPLVIGTLTGLAMGPVMAVARTGSGVVDVLTFWVPGFHGWPMSKPVLGLSG